MSKTLKSASSDVGRYAVIADRYCQKKFGGIEGRETICGAIIIAMVLRDSAEDITVALNDVASKIENIDTVDVSGIESAIEELMKSVGDVADRM